MKTRTILSALTTLAAAFASADHNWHLDSTYTYALTGNVGTSVLHDVEKVMEGGSVDGSYGWGVSSSFEGGNVGTTALSLDTYPFFGTAAARPILERSFLFGVIDDLPNDAPGQNHLVLFVNPTAAARMSGLAFGTVFGTINQGNPPLTEEGIIEATLFVHTDASDRAKRPYYDTLDFFRNAIAKNANVGVNGTKDSVWFAPSEGFRIVTFSDGLIVGEGTNAFNATIAPVPEPACFAALGLGAAALLRRRKAR